MKLNDLHEGKELEVKVTFLSSAHNQGLIEDTQIFSTWAEARSFIKQNYKAKQQQTLDDTEDKFGTDRMDLILSWFGKWRGAFAYFDQGKVVRAPSMLKLGDWWEDVITQLERRDW